MRANPKLELIYGGLSEPASDFGRMDKTPDEILKAVELGISSQEWAGILGVSERWVRTWKSGMSPVDKKYLKGIARRALAGLPDAEARLHDIRVLALSILNNSALDEIKGDL